VRRAGGHLYALAYAPKQKPSLVTRLADLLRRTMADTRARGQLTARPASALVAPPVGQVWKTYYFAGGQVIAMRVEGDPNPANNGLY